MLARFSGAFARQTGRVGNQTFRPVAFNTSSRFFSSANEAQNDGSLHDRYAFALFDASRKSGKTDKVFEDLASLKDSIVNSEDFRVLLSTPGITSSQKDKILSEIATKIGSQDITVNLVKLLIENRRLGHLSKVIDSFEKMYRTSKGEVICVVSSAKELSNSEKQKVEAALKKRVGAGKTAVVSYKVSPTIMGGLQVAYGDAVLDYSVASKIGRFENLLQNSI